MGVINTSPRAAAVAGPEPETAPQKMQAITAAIANPPRRLPVSNIKKRAMPSTIFDLSMSTPASIKNGIATRGNLAILASKFRDIMDIPRS
ncbi:MAG: hypothetical protein BWX44_01216 [Spirochaetes bacterium ADurb.Bin001]|nr:MAG: hypothetical protein BWX44_01216 [Spirochaetes bacterium ADurb.Bin001]